MALPLFTPRPPLLPPFRPPSPSPTSIQLSRSDNNHPPNPTTAPSKRCKTPTPPHPAFSRAARGHARIPLTDPTKEGPIHVTDRGLAYRLDGAPFEFQYSYTESPRARPLALREKPFLPFGPEGAPRPWTGRRPLPKSRKEVPEFDSFRLPPPGKKGVKPVQSPGPFLAGVEPRYEAASREEVMGEPLTAAEVAELVKSSLKTKRQLNIGRDGLTHNMLVNIHAHWKRKRVCKIKCRGVCTVDMDNVCQQLEEKVGGKVIHRHGGVVFLFRGRNYNYRTRPRFPLMLWKPIAPVYPRLVKKVPDDLTLEEAIEMRRRGRELLPICTLGKNGVYINLVKQVREAFEACDLVRVDCSGLNKSDCRKIGAKLKDLVPCVLLSFEFEHILIWRGSDWKSSLPALEENTAPMDNGYCLNNQVVDSGIAQTSDLVVSTEMPLENISLAEGAENLNHLLKSDPVNDILPRSATAIPGLYGSIDTAGYVPSASSQLEFSALDAENDLLDPSLELSCKSIPSYKNENRELVEGSPDEGIASVPLADCYIGFSCTENCDEIDKLETSSRNIGELDTKCRDSMKSDLTSKPTPSYFEGVLLLLKQAVDTGSALVLDEDEFFDADLVYQKSVAFMNTAPKGPAFQHMPRKCTARRNESDKQLKHDKQYGEHKVSTHTEKKDNANKVLGMWKRNDAQEFVLDVVPQGTLRVDELAKLLA